VTPKIELPQGEVHVWTELVTWTDALIAEARATLSTEENERADRFAHDIHRNRYLISHLKFREILAQYLTVTSREMRFHINEFGKPFLAAAENPAGINFNLSHSGERMLLGLVRNAKIGVDIEEIRPESASLDVAARFFTDRENEELRSLSGREQVEAFFNCWTRKEAYLKALGCGLSIDPKDCEVSLLPTALPKLLKSAGEFRDKDSWSLFHLSEPGYIGAIAVDYPCTVKRKSG
jgi:4'-phosphopantetheinyl transferase